MTSTSAWSSKPLAAVSGPSPWTRTVDAAGRPELRRFFTGVIGCEVTGVSTTPEQRTMFVNLQHPGGTWPQNDGLATPRAQRQ